jgi:hypothetical protein
MAAAAAGAAAAAAAARVRTIHPDRITSVADWYKYYERKYANLVTDGALYLVLDPEQMKEDPEAARDAPVKTFQPPKGRDYITILANTQSPEELRVAAIAKRDALVQGRADAIQTARTEFVGNERELLAAVDAWAAAETADGRAAATQGVVFATEATAVANAAYIESIYHYRSEHEEESIARKLLQPETRDDRKLPYSLYRPYLQVAAPKERIIAGDMA